MSAFVAYAYRVGVVAFDVAAFQLHGAAVVEVAVSADVEMVAGILTEATGPVAGGEFLDGEGLGGAGVAAVKDNEPDLPRPFTPHFQRSLPIRTQQGLQFRL